MGGNKEQKENTKRKNIRTWVKISRIRVLIWD